MITEEVTLSRAEQLGTLTVNALNVLHDRYCCPDHCPQCMVLASLLTTGELDETVNQAPSWVVRHPVWQVVGIGGKRVNRHWLYSRWDPEQNNCCTYYDLDEDAEEEVKPRRRARVIGPRTPATKACEAHRRARKKCTCLLESVAA